MVKKYEKIRILHKLDAAKSNATLISKKANNFINILLLFR